MEATPTLAQFSAYQQAYDFFNVQLFEGKLQPCLLNLRGTSRLNVGFFSPDKWAQGDALTHEIALNPDWLSRPFEKTMGTLVHEMVHQWQHDNGKPAKGGYHDREWGAKMESVGLIPSDTGQPGGKKTGRQMTHYPAEGGPFLLAVKRMPESIRLPWLTAPRLEKTAPTKNKNKVKHECPCGQKAWGKAELHIVCAECGESFQADGGGVAQTHD